MRWIWIDRFIEFESGRYAKAIKNITLAEDYLHDHFYGHPVMPNSLILEGLAQTGGILVGEFNNFDEKVILAKVTKVRFHFAALPGDTLIYHATVDNIREGGARVKATAHIGERLQSEAEIVFAHLDDTRVKNLFEPKNFVFTLKLLGVFDVGRASDSGAVSEPLGLTRLKRSGGADAPTAQNTLRAAGTPKESDT